MVAVGGPGRCNHDGVQGLYERTGENGSAFQVVVRDSIQLLPKAGQQPVVLPREAVACQNNGITYS